MFKHLTKMIFIVIMLGTCNFSTYAQTVMTQNLNFGYFVPNTSGYITISATGVRSSSGVIIPPGSTFTPAIFRHTSKGKTTINSVTLSVVTQPTVNGKSLSLTLLQPNNSFPISLANGAYVDFMIGGTLTVGTISTNPAGIYVGSIQITIN